MRSLLVVEYVSLDGVIQAPGHAGEDPDGGFAHGGWTGPFMADHRRYNSRLYPTAGAFLLGRRTYEIFAASWPTVTDPTDRIALALNSQPKYVVSTTLFEAAWPGTTVLTGDAAEQVAKLKQQPGGPVLVIGSATLAQTLLAHDLVDEYQLWLHPVVLGSGKRLFDDRDGSPVDLQLVDSTTTRAASPRIVVGVGEASQGQMPHLAALALAERLGTKPVEFPGDHQGFATHPGPFAQTVHQALRRS